MNAWNMHIDSYWYLHIHEHTKSLTHVPILNLNTRTHTHTNTHTHTHKHTHQFYCKWCGQWPWSLRRNETTLPDSRGHSPTGNFCPSLSLFSPLSPSISHSFQFSLHPLFFYPLLISLPLHSFTFHGHRYNQRDGHFVFSISTSWILLILHLYGSWAKVLTQQYSSQKEKIQANTAQSRYS